MRMISLLRIASLVTACSFAAACSDGSGPQDLDLDDVLADVNAGQSFAASGLDVVAGAPVAPPPAAMHHDACAFNSGSQMFVCPGTTINGITFNRSFQLLDAAGAPQSEYSRATTAAVRTVSDVSGRITSTTNNVTTTIDLTSHDDATLSGLLSGTHVLNGSSTGNAAIAGGGLNHNVATSTTVTNLQLPRRDSDTRYPASGTVASQAVVTAPGFSNTTTATLSFNGSSTATLVVTTLGITRTCQIDLSPGHAAPVCTP
jgi:hypothetical protein